MIDVFCRVYVVLSLLYFLKKTAPKIKSAIKMALASAKAYAGMKEAFTAPVYSPPTEEEYKALVADLDKQRLLVVTWKDKYFELLKVNNGEKNQ